MNTKTLSIVLIATLLLFADSFSQVNSLLIGVWGFKKGDNAIFEIKPDFIYYVDAMKSINYKATNDSLIFFFDGYRYNTRYRVTNDSLIVYRGNKVESKYIRFTE